MDSFSTFFGNTCSEHSVEKIEYAPNGIQFFLISFDSKKIHWKDFREKFIGVTNPKKAMEGSLRHYLYHNYESMDLTTQPAGSDNGIHASASPVEAGMFLRVNFFVLFRLPHQKYVLNYQSYIYM